MSIWYDQDAPEIKRLTKKLAKEYATMEGCPGDRPLSERRLKGIIKTVTAGDFRTCDWASAYCEETDEVYRVNGKHTSNAFNQIYTNGNAAALSNVRIVITHYYLKTLEDLARLYATFDSRTSLRTVGDINKMFAAADEQLQTVSQRAINTCVSGIAMFTHQFKKYEESPTQRAERMLDHIDFVLFYDEMQRTAKDSADRKMIYRSPVCAAMFATYKKAPQKALEFWTAVRDGSGIDPAQPDRVLNKFLMRTHLGKERKTFKERATSEEMYAKAIHCWNNWRRGRTVKHLKFKPEGPLPKAS